MNFKWRKSDELAALDAGDRLGDDTALVGLPGEVFVELGLAIKQASPFANTMVIELSQDCPDYVPTRKAFAEGSYETVSSWGHDAGKAGPEQEVAAVCTRTSTASSWSSRPCRPARFTSAAPVGAGKVSPPDPSTRPMFCHDGQSDNPDSRSRRRCSGDPHLSSSLSPMSPKTIRARTGALMLLPQENVKRFSPWERAGTSPTSFILPTSWPV